MRAAKNAQQLHSEQQKGAPTFLDGVPMEKVFFEIKMPSLQKSKQFLFGK